MGEERTGREEGEKGIDMEPAQHRFRSAISRKMKMDLDEHTSQIF